MLLEVEPFFIVNFSFVNSTETIVPLGYSEKVPLRMTSSMLNEQKATSL